MKQSIYTITANFGAQQNFFSFFFFVIIFCNLLHHIFIYLNSSISKYKNNFLWTLLISSYLMHATVLNQPQFIFALLKTLSRFVGKFSSQVKALFFHFSMQHNSSIQRITCCEFQEEQQERQEFHFLFELLFSRCWMHKKIYFFSRSNSLFLSLNVIHFFCAFLSRHF